MSVAVREYVLTLSCRDARGIVHAVAGLLLDAGCNILDSQQFGDLGRTDATGLFFMRVHFEAPPGLGDAEALVARAAPLVARFAMELAVHPLDRRPRLLLLASREAHCLNDLLFRCGSGQIAADVVGVVSNHPDVGGLCDRAGVPFRHLPIAAGASADARRAQEHAIETIVAEQRVDLVVLARYMQILTPALCETLRGRAINIHHSFLPSFAGAQPYLQAHRRGVKLIGATAHYVTPELDDGPIIEQDVLRVGHGLGPDDLSAAGRDVECVVLARAVRWHLEHRVLINGRRTVVFA